MECLSAGELLQRAKDMFDANLSEMLHSHGQWHWRLEIREVAELVAETLSFEEEEEYEHVRTALLEHYEDQYRRPTAQELKSYLRKKEGDLV